MLFHHVKNTLSSQNNTSTVEDTKLESTSNQEKVFKKPKSQHLRQPESRSSKYYLEDSIRGNHARVDFRRKGSVNFSYSFLPGDVT